MRFKAKDLLVTISPNLEINPELVKKFCIWRTRICIRPSIWPCHWVTWHCRPCTFLFTWCGPCSFVGTAGCGQFNSCGPDGSVCDPTIFCAGHSVFEIEDPADLVTLREELNDVLQQLDRLEKEGLPSQFNTPEQAAQAEQALEAALEDIRRQKKNL
jgi:hypothetical protein